MNQPTKYPQIPFLSWKTNDGVIRGHVIMITKAMAAYFLHNHNAQNRPYSSKVIGKYTYDRITDRFDLTPAPIVFGTDGNIMDGQHRLYMILYSGLETEMLVITNVPVEHEAPDGVKFRVQSVLDEGNVKKLKQSLEEKHIEGAARVSRTINQIVAHWHTAHPISVARALDVISIFPEEFKLLATMPLPAACDQPPVHAALVVLHKAWPGKTNEFIEKLAQAAAPNSYDTSALDASQALVTKLSLKDIAVFGGKKPAIVNLTLKAFDLFRQGKKVPVSELRVPHEHFPFKQEIRDALAAEFQTLRSIFPTLKKMDLDAEYSDEKILKARARQVWVHEFREIHPDEATAALRDTTFSKGEMVRIMRYAAIMFKGRWAKTVEAIVLNYEGKVLPGAGRKRLKACELSNKPLWALVVMADELSVNYGAGYVRSFKGQLGVIKGNVKQAPALQVIGRLLLGPSVRQGLSPVMGEMLSKMFGKSINAILTLAEKAHAVTTLRTGSVIGCLSLVHKAYPKAAAALAFKLFANDQLEKGTPTFNLWTELSAERSNKGGRATDIAAQLNVVRDILAIITDDPHITTTDVMPHLMAKSSDLQKAAKMLNLRQKEIAELEEEIAAREEKQAAEEATEAKE
jgi:hypothetical protein